MIRNHYKKKDVVLLEFVVKVGPFVSDETFFDVLNSAGAGLWLDVESTA